MIPASFSTLSSSPVLFAVLTPSGSCAGILLQRATDFLDTHSQFAICFHRVVNYYEEDGSKSLSNGHQRKITTISDLAESNYITNSSSVFRRCYYPEMPEWFAKFTSCDYALHLLNAQHGNIYYFGKPMAVYRKHSKGIWSELPVYHNE